MPNYHISAVFFVMDSIILHIILKVNKLNCSIAFYISIVLVFDIICQILTRNEHIMFISYVPRSQLPVCFGFTYYSRMLFG